MRHLDSGFGTLPSREPASAEVSPQPSAIKKARHRCRGRLFRVEVGLEFDVLAEAVGQGANFSPVVFPG